MRLSLNFKFRAAATVAGTVVVATAAADLREPAPVRAGTPRATVERELGMMGTLLTVRVTAASRPQALSLSESAVRALERVETRLSTWRPDSELTRLNHQPAGVFLSLSPALLDDLGAARRCWAETDGAFDPGVGALVDAWHLRDGGGPAPAADALRAAVEQGGLAHLALGDAGAVRLTPGLAIEEGGFGKGVGLDAALAALVGGGAEAALLDLGGQLALIEGSPPETVAVAHPRDRDRLVAAITLRGGSIATTGNGERAIVTGGERRGHLLDPRSGLPAPDFGSLTVLAPDATTADCLSTGLYVMGPDAALAWAARREGIDVVCIETEPLRVRASAGLEGRIRPLDPAVSIVFVGAGAAPASGSPTAAAPQERQRGQRASSPDPPPTLGAATTPAPPESRP